MQDYPQLMTTAMELKGFAKSTQKNYLSHLHRFAEFCGKDPTAASYDDVRAFLHHAITQRKLSSSYVNCVYGAIKFFYQAALGREWNMLYVPRVKRNSSLPVILSPQEVFRILQATNNLKHKAILTTIYSAGLRVSEAAHLLISDISRSNMRIFVRLSKGRKDRYSILSEKNLLLLIAYWKQYRPQSWLFPGKPASEPITTRSIQAVFQKSVAAAGITKDVSVHTLRHCFATHLLNNGASILQIKELLGHADIKTTTMYLHLTHAQVLGLKSPLDGGDFHA